MEEEEGPEDGSLELTQRPNPFGKADQRAILSLRAGNAVSLGVIRAVLGPGSPYAISHCPLAFRKAVPPYDRKAARKVVKEHQVEPN